MKNRTIPRGYEKVKLNLTITRDELDRLISMFAYDYSDFASHYMKPKLNEAKQKHG